jgi:hypothetical protein
VPVRVLVTSAPLEPDRRSTTATNASATSVNTNNAADIDANSGRSNDRTALNTTTGHSVLPAALTNDEMITRDPRERPEDRGDHGRADRDDDRRLDGARDQRVAERLLEPVEPEA